MHILVGIHQNLANGTSPELLSQEQVNHLMQSTFEADDGNGAPGSDHYRKQLDHSTSEWSNELRCPLRTFL